MEVRKINDNYKTKCCACSDFAHIRIVTEEKEMCLCEKHARTLKARLFYMMGGTNEK